jgi:hypothetical protein
MSRARALGGCRRRCAASPWLTQRRLAGYCGRLSIATMASGRDSPHRVAVLPSGAPSQLRAPLSGLVVAVAQGSPVIARTRRSYLVAKRRSRTRSVTTMIAALAVTAPIGARIAGETVAAGEPSEPARQYIRRSSAGPGRDAVVSVRVSGQHLSRVDLPRRNARTEWLDSADDELELAAIALLYLLFAYAPSVWMRQLGLVSPSGGPRLRGRG